MDIAVAQQFLRENENAVLATWRRDGRLQMSPVTVGLDAAGRAIIASRETAYKVRNLRRDPRATLEYVRNTCNFSLQGLMHGFQRAFLVLKGLAVSSYPARIAQTV